MDKKREGEIVLAVLEKQLKICQRKMDTHTKKGHALADEFNTLKELFNNVANTHSP